MSTVQARDVTPGMVLERLTYGLAPSPGGVLTVPSRPVFKPAAVVEVSTSILTSVESGEADRVIRWSDGATESYAPHHRFVLVEEGSP